MSKSLERKVKEARQKELHELLRLTSVQLKEAKRNGDMDEIKKLHDVIKRVSVHINYDEGDHGKGFGGKHPSNLN